MASYDEVAAQLTGPGAPFETHTIERNGYPVTAFKNVPATLREIFASARTRGEQTFLVYEDERRSFAEVMAEVDALAAALLSHYGVRKGDRVAIGMRNYPEWVIAFAAITSIGAISVSLNAWWTEDELDFALEDSGAILLIADVERMERAAASCARLGCRILAVRSGTTLAPGAERWGDVVEIGAAMPDVEVGADDDATILYTSGTTGRPKGAVSTHGAICQALMGFGCRTAIERMRRPEAPRAADAPPPNPLSFILIVPLFHVTGSVPVLLSCVSAGLKLVMMHKWDAERALQLIEREKVTNFVGVPTQSWDLVECEAFGRYDTSSLLSVGGGGAPAPPELVKKVDGSFSKGRPQIGYGMTETNAYGPGNTGQDYVEHPTSTGRGTPILQIEIRDADGKPVPVGERGEIFCKGPFLFRGYWNRPDATAETLIGGWLRTGDLGRLDEEGFLYIEDRAKDMILRGGENVYSAEVEAALYEHPAVYEAAVFGVPHERLGEEVACAVVPRPGMAIDPDELRTHVRERLAGFKVPTIVHVVEGQLPRNAAGKILKRELRDELAAQAEVKR
jgi:long-chain acyl-CoA synthetase